MPDKKTPSPEDIADDQNLSPDKEEQSVDPSYSSAENSSEAGAEEQLADEDMEEAAESSSSADEMKDQLLRALADVENMRRRSERDVAQANKYGHLSFARDLLSCFDNLSQAVSLAPEDKSDFDENLKNILVGVEMISTEIDTILQRHHITKINPIGEKFNYNHHQAMFEVPNNEVEAGTVVQVAQPGYLLHDRLIRPAMVGVSKKVSSTETDDNSSVDKQA
jgi:molecular chaperone GrpE